MKKIIVFWAIFTIFAVACNENIENKNNVRGNNVANNKKSKLSGKILEVLDVDKYTYVRIKNSDNKEIWLAGPKENVKVGQKVSVYSGMLMKDFVSKTLNRTFKEIYFVGSLTGKSKTGFHGSMHGGGFHSKSGAKINERLRAEIEKKYDIKKIDKINGGYTIEEIYSKMKELNGKKIKIKGQVVKYSPEIMNRNWVHLRDGSGGNNSNDLTITTTEKVKEGDVVSFEGVLSVDKDFGYGYKYKVILEKSTLIK
jgi:hypothetical protein